MRKAVVLLLTSSLGVFFPVATSAQSTDDAVATETDAAGAGQGDIVVTARMRGERLKDIPDTITAFSGDMIDRAAITSVKDFVNLTPNITLLPSFRQGVFNLTSRGDSTPQGGGLSDRRQL